MNRAEELALKFLDADLSAAESAEFARLLADPAAAQSAQALFEIEAALRAEHRVDLSHAVLAEIQRIQGDRVSRAVLNSISERKAATVLRRSRYIHWVNAAVAAAALIAVAIFAFWKPAADPSQISKTPDEKPAPLPVRADKILFSQDFDNGLPENWTVGTLETTGLPPGVKGAVRQPPQPVNGRYGVHSPKYDKSPLAQIQKGDVVHFTFRTDRSGPLKLQVGLHRPEVPRFVSCESMYQSVAGQWQTIDLPIQSFSNSAILDDYPKLNCIGYAVGADNLGLVLTRFWISRKSP